MFNEQVLYITGGFVFRQFHEGHLTKLPFVGRFEYIDVILSLARCSKIAVITINDIIGFPGFTRRGHVVFELVMVQLI